MNNLYFDCVFILPFALPYCADLSNEPRPEYKYKVHQVHHKPHHSQEDKLHKVVLTSEHPAGTPLKEKVVPAVIPGEDNDDDDEDDANEVDRPLPSPAYLKGGNNALNKPSHGDKPATMSDVYFLGEGLYRCRLHFGCCAVKKHHVFLICCNVSLKSFCF